MGKKLDFSVEAKDVFSTIESKMLRDGFDIVIDMEKSKGSHIVNALDGREWLDFYTFFASAPFGMNHPKLDNDEFKDEIFRAAVNKVANSDIYTVDMAQFVKAFSAVAMPEEFTHLFLIDYGTLAIENALKAAMDWKVRKLIAKGTLSEEAAIKGKRGTKVIYFNEAFHGRGGYTLSLTNTHDPNKHKYFAKFNDWIKVLNPKIFWPLEENLHMIEWAEKQSIKQIMEGIAENPDDICALIIETIQGEGGDNHFRPEFFRQLRKICDENEILLILDEVQCGMGITGKMWAFQNYGITPDIFAFGKKAQVCGICATSRLDETGANCWNTSSRLNSTWGGNIADMVRGRRYLEIYEEEDILDYVANSAGPELLKGLGELQKEFPALISNVRGKGLMCAYDLPDTETRNRLLKALHDARVLIMPCGPASIRYRPALNVPLKDIDKGLDITRLCLKKF